MNIKRYITLFLLLLALPVAGFSQTVHLSLTVNNPQGGTPWGEGDYEPGEKVIIDMSMEYYYAFDGWFTDEGKMISSAALYEYKMPDHDVHLEARVSYSPGRPGDPSIDDTPEPTLYTLTLITLPPNLDVEPQTWQLSEGGRHVFSNASYTDYYFWGWYDEEDVLLQTTSASFYYTMPAHDVTIYAKYSYSPTRPSNPLQNGCHVNEDGAVELIMDHFTSGSLASAIKTTLTLANKTAEQVEKLTIKGSVQGSDGRMNSLLKELRYADYTATDMAHLPSSAFSEMGALRTVLLPATLQSIGNEAFYQCQELSSLTCLAVTPPSIESRSFEGMNNGTLVYVPAASVGQYKEAEGWKRFVIMPVKDQITALRVLLPEGCDDGRCRDMRLEAVNTSSAVSQRYIVSTRSEYVFDALPGSAYNVNLVNRQGIIVSQIKDIPVDHDTVSVRLPAMTTLHDVALQILDSKGTDVSSQVTARWYDDSDRYLSQGLLLPDMAEGTSLKVALKLDDRLARTHLQPDIVNYTVTDGDNNIVASLQPLAMHTFQGQIVSGEDGSYVVNAQISATQTLNGDFLQTYNATTDDTGHFELTLCNASPAAISASADGFLPSKLNIENLDGIESLPLIQLEPATGRKIVLSLRGTLDASDLWFDIYNITRDTVVTSFDVSFPYLTLPESVAEDHQLRLTVHSHANHFEPFEQTINVADGKAELNIETHGSVSVSYAASNNSEVRAMLYDAAGQLVEGRDCMLRNAQFQYLPEGQYSVLLMGKNSLFADLSTLDAFASLGLEAGKHYVQQTVSVQRGKTTEVDVERVPLFVEEHFSYVKTEGTPFLCLSSDVRNGFAATFRAKIDFKDTYSGRVSNLRLIVRHAHNAPLVNGSVVVDNSLHPYEQGEDMFVVDDLSDGDEVKFCLQPRDDGLLSTTAYIEFSYDGTTLRQSLGTATTSATSVKLDGPKNVSIPEVSVSLNDIPYGEYSSIVFYDNGIPVTTISDFRSSSWTEHINQMLVTSSGGGSSGGGMFSYSKVRHDYICIDLPLKDAYFFSKHRIQAKLIDKDGHERYTPVKTVDYNPTILQLEGIGVRQPRMPFAFVSYSRSSGTSRSYTVKPSNNLVPLQYYAQFDYNPYLDDLVKGIHFFTNIHRNGKKYHSKKTARGPIPEFEPWMPRDTHYPDLDYLYQETVKTDDLPQSIAVETEFNKIDLSADNNLNNRFVKEMKRQIAQMDSLIDAYIGYIEQCKEENSKEEPDFGLMADIMGRAHECIVRLNDGRSTTLTAEVEELIERLVDPETSEDEYNAIWQQLSPDRTNTPEYQKMQEEAEQMQTSHVEFPPYEMGENMWTPAVSYEIGTPTTGNFLEDMSDGNWHLEEDTAGERPRTLVYVNDKGGDRLTIDFSQRPNIFNKPLQQARGRGKARRAPGDEINLGDAQAWQTAKIDALSPAVSAVESASESAIDKIYLTTGYEREISYYQKELRLADKTLSDPTLLTDDKIDYWTRTQKHSAEKLDKLYKYEVEAGTKRIKGLNGITASKIAGQVLGAGLSIGITAYNSNNNWEAYFANKDSWDDLINWADNNCDDSADGLIDWARQQRDRQRLVDGAMVAEGGFSGLLSAITSIKLSGAAGWAATAALIGVDVLNAKLNGDLQVAFEQDRLDFKQMIQESSSCSKMKIEYEAVNPLIDPSGYVYEAVPSNRLQDVEATIYFRDSLQNAYGDWEVRETIWNAEEYGQQNPQHTNAQGKYGWDVPIGLWQVRYRKDGYEQTASEWLPVPPPQLEVNIPMVQRTAPEVAMVHAYQDAIELMFSKYMLPDSLNARNLHVKAIVGGQETEVSDLKVELLDEEAAAKGSQTTYASRLRLTSEAGWQEADELVLIVDGRVRSYCGVPMQQTFIQHLDAEKRIEEIVVDSLTTLSPGSTGQLRVSVLPADASAGKTLRLEPTFDGLVELSQTEIVIDENGEALIDLTARQEGITDVRISIDGELTEGYAILAVRDKDAIAVQAPKASLASGTSVYRGTRITLRCEEDEDATIWYTLDGSCPCNQRTAIKYDPEQPILITGDDVRLQAIAVDADGAESEVAEFVYTLKRTDLTYELEGWDWISHNMDEPVPVSDFSDVAERIVGQEGEAVIDSQTDLAGSLEQLMPATGYKVKTFGKTVKNLTGYTWNAQEGRVPLKSGWNWIGYPLNRAIALQEALALFEPKEGDYIVGQADEGFAEYVDGTWANGTLECLRPGHGYLYRSGAETELLFNALADTTEFSGGSELTAGAAWAFDAHAYSCVMPLTAQLADGSRTASIAAFVGDECRGVGQWREDRLLLSICGEKGEEVSFRLYDPETGEMLRIKELLTLADDDPGSWNAPFTLTLDDGNPIRQTPDDRLLQTPNVFGDHLSVSARGCTISRLMLTDMGGRTVFSVGNLGSGATLTTASLPAGIYILTVVADGRTYYRRIVRVRD